MTPPGGAGMIFGFALPQTQLPTMILHSSLTVAALGLIALSAPCQGADATKQGGIPACEDMKTTASGLQWGILKPGKGGKSPADGDSVEVHYTGWLTDGTKFDSSRDRGATSKFGVNQVIPGWTEGLKLMTPGMRCKFVIPGDIAYGPSGRPPKIPANATLVFDVELVNVISMPKLRKVNPDKQKTFEAGPAKGVKVEVVKPGTGEMCGKGYGVAARYAFWDKSGRLLDCSEKSGQKLGGVLDALPLPFLKPLLESCKVGEIILAEVPESVWGNARSDTFWELELISVNPVPAFRMIDKEKIVTTQSGLQYEVIKQGEGESPKATNTVKAHYSGWTTDGKMFDSSHARGEPSEFPLNRVIKGWTEGLQLMKPGAKFLFQIPADLGYGAAGSPPKIPGNATLIFLVELVEFK